MGLSPVITCEHAGNEVPSRYQNLFAKYGELLQTHRGWDPGAVGIARFMAATLSCPVFSCAQTRLLVDVNRSLDSAELFSGLVPVPEGERENILKEIYHPYRKSVEEVMFSIPRPVLHVSVHSFTPVLNGITRKVDVGILFDPGRTGESRIANNLLMMLRKRLPDLRIRFNEPYLGTDDGFTTHLRKVLKEDEYFGLELEISQRFNGTAEMDRVQKEISAAISEILN